MGAQSEQFRPLFIFCVSPAGVFCSALPFQEARKGWNALLCSALGGYAAHYYCRHQSLRRALLSPYVIAYRHVQRWCVVPWRAVASGQCSCRADAKIESERNCIRLTSHLFWELEMCHIMHNFFLAAKFPQEVTFPAHPYPGISANRLITVFPM